MDKTLSCWLSRVFWAIPVYPSAFTVLILSKSGRTWPLLSLSLSLSLSFSAHLTYGRLPARRSSSMILPVIQTLDHHAVLRRDLCEELIHVSECYQKRAYARSLSGRRLIPIVECETFHKDLAASAKKRQRPTVRFSDYQEVMLYDGPSEEDYEHLYYGVEGIQSIQKHIKSHTREKAEQQPELVQCIEELFDTRKSLKMEKDGTVKLSEMELEAINLLNEADLRGVENKLCPVMRAHRRWAVRSVLALQDKLRGDEDPSRIQGLLRAKSSTVSRRARQYAMKLAKADLLEAQKISCDEEVSII